MDISDVYLVFCLSFIYLFLAVLCLHCALAFSGCSKLEGGLLPSFRGQSSHCAGFSGC